MYTTRSNGQQFYAIVLVISCHKYRIHDGRRLYVGYGRCRVTLVPVPLVLVLEIFLHFLLGYASISEWGSGLRAIELGDDMRVD